MIFINLTVEHTKSTKKYASGSQLPRVRGDKLKKLAKWVQ